MAFRRKKITKNQKNYQIVYIDEVVSQKNEAI